MKKLFLLFALVGFAALGTVQAQCHGKKSAATTEVNTNDEAAAKLASMDETIERRVCEKSGNVSYWQKSTCEKSGNVSFTQVSYDASANKFVNVSPEEVHGKSSSAKSCCAGGASAKGVSSKKSCSSASKGGACCSSKKASASTESSEKVQFKAVSQDSGTN